MLYGVGAFFHVSTVLTFFLFRSFIQYLAHMAITFEQVRGSIIDLTQWPGLEERTRILR